MSEFEKQFVETEIRPHEPTYIIKNKIAIKQLRKQGWVAALKCMLTHQFTLRDVEYQVDVQAIPIYYIEQELKELENE